VAIVGICQVLEGSGRNRLYGLFGPLARAVGAGVLDSVIDASDDVLRRTNRGIFADSVPTVLYGLRAHELRQAGRGALADALLVGPPPLAFDDQSVALARALADGLSLSSPTARFSVLATLTRRHFEREQAIFTHHLGRRTARESALVRRLTTLKAVPAPVIERGHLRFRPYSLPAGFDMRDHAARVRELTRAFVDPIVADETCYRVAVEYVISRFGRLR
jgi:hypothetical protein